MGDIVFIRVSALPFKKIAHSTNSWTNHVGIVVDFNGQDAVIAESRFPFSGTTTLSRFAARSEGGKMEVRRLNQNLTRAQEDAIRAAAEKREGILYDTGFNLHSRRQFCSRFVREVVEEATGTELGQVETLSQLFSQNPQADLGFWRAWYFGSIPWQRETITPASELESPLLHTVFSGYVS